jgi:predicted GNAT family N-acyltransferase
MPERLRPKKIKEIVPDRSTKETSLNDDTEKIVESNLRESLNAGGVFSKVSNDALGRESTVVDTDALKRVIKELSARYVSSGRVAAPVSALFRALPSAMGAMQVLTKAQLERKDFTEKPLLYIPETPDAATDAVSIKNADFHHFVDDFADVQHRDQQPYPTADGGEGAISTKETRTAAIIFHPDFGDGFRNEKGTLFVRDKMTRKYRPFSGDFLKSYGVKAHDFYQPVDGRTKNSDSPQRSLRDVVIEDFPHLVEKGLIQPVRDLREQTHGRLNAKNQRIEKVGVSSSGSRMMRGVVHYIGKQFAGHDVRIIEISPTIGAVVDVSTGVQRISHTFNIVSRDQAKEGSNGFYLAGAGITRPRPFSAKTIALPRKADETKEKYLDRIEMTDRGLAHMLLKVFPKHPQLANMLRDRPLYEQTAIAETSYTLARSKQEAQFDHFVNKYGIDGARTFLVTAQNEVFQTQVFELEEDIDPEQLKNVFAAYGRVIDDIENLDRYLQSQFGEKGVKAIQDVTGKILKRASNVLLSAHLYRNNPEKLRALIEEVSTGTRLFTDACRTLHDRGELNPSEIAGSEFMVLPSGALGDLGLKMRDIQSQRYGPNGSKYNEKYPELYSALNESLKKKIENPEEKTHFYVYKKDGELVGFFRLDDQVDSRSVVVSKHLASVMGDTRFAGGKIMETLLEQTIASQNVPIVAECDRDGAIAQRYFAMGFVKTGEKEELGLPIYSIQLIPRASSQAVIPKAA